MGRLMLTPTSKKKIDYNDERHEYSVDGKIKPGVSGLLQMAGLSKDISLLSESHQENIKRAGRKGTIVHTWYEIIDKGEESKYERPPAAIQPYIDAYRRFKDDLKIEIVANELMGYSEYGDYCGRTDGIWKIKGELYLGDTKTAKTINPNGRLQTMGYTYFFKEPLKRMLFQPKDDGTYCIYDDGKYGKKFLDDAVDKDVWEAILRTTNWIRNVAK